MESGKDGKLLLDLSKDDDELDLDSLGDLDMMIGESDENLDFDNTGRGKEQEFLGLNAEGE